MAHWLFKSEPSAWSWQDQRNKGAAGEEWDGVRNYQARNFMRQMVVGERGFFYHTQAEKAIVGTVEIIRAAHPDSTDGTGKWDCVDIMALQTAQHPVTLAEIKADPRLADMALVKSPRLSVQPVGDAEWAILCEMAGLKAE